MSSLTLAGDDLARRNALLLAVAQALFAATTIVVIATGGLVGLMLAPKQSWATAPITAFVAGSMAATIPASLIMQSIGRRNGFIIGAFIGLAGALTCMAAIFIASFWLFCFGAALQGMFQGTSQFFRFAAADQASPAFKPKAISWVLTGGIAAAIIGTGTASYTADLLPPYTYAGSYAANAVLALATVAVLAFLRFPPAAAQEAGGPARPLSELVRQPRLIAAVSVATLAYGMMSLMMTSTPIAMVACGFSKDLGFWVIMQHVLAMFVPSFFTGHLVARFGAMRIAVVGMILLIAAGVVALAGITLANFSAALILLGIGWNFGFIGGTTLLTDCYRQSERGKVQALNDFSISTAMVIVSFASGVLLSEIGWIAVAVAIFPLAAIALALLVWGTSDRASPARS
jgi:MFS family permease